MSVFTESKLEYLGGQSLARVATVGRDGQPHITPVTFHYNEEEDAIDVGGMFFGGTKKWRDAQGNQRVTLLIDDVIPKPRQARAIEVRGTAELHETGGETVNPRFSNFARGSSGSVRLGSCPGASKTSLPQPTRKTSG
jgi:pyridoxamine 5'-phosphate oxidase family protein